MRKLLFVIVVLSLIGYYGHAQTSPADTALVKDFKLNFAVPDLPAFKILGTNPSNLLRPSSPEAVAAMLSDFGAGGQVILPQSFAGEIAPYILIKSNSLTLKEYDDNAALYSLRFSIGTQRDPVNDLTSHLALGARMTLVDKGDLKNDKDYRAKLSDLLLDKVKTKDNWQLKFLQDNNYTIQQVLLDTTLNQQMEAYIESKLTRNYDQALDSMTNAYKEVNWNKAKFDIAIAALGTSPDTLAKDTKFSQFSFWATYGLPIGQGGQLLLGYNLNYYTANDLESINKYATNSIISRLYGGVNKYKGFLELQYKRDGNLKSNFYFANLGGEFAIMDGVWGNISAGLERNWTNGTNQFSSHFDLRFTIPEKLKLF